MPKITVLMSVYNGEKYLNKCIESILNQSFSDFEFLIIEDGSTDNTIEILNSYKDKRIRIIKNEVNIGLVQSLNKGLLAANSELICRMDADDWSESTRLDKQVKCLERDPKLVLIGSYMNHVDSEGKFISLLKVPLNNLEIKFRMMFETAIFHPTVMFRKKPVIECGMYSSSYRHAEDADLWRRLRAYGTFMNLPISLCSRRWHSESICNKHQNIQLELGTKLRLEMMQELCPNINKNHVSDFFYSLVVNSKIKNIDDLVAYNEIVVQIYTKFVAQNLPNEGQNLKLLKEVSELINRNYLLFKINKELIN